MMKSLLLKIKKFFTVYIILSFFLLLILVSGALYYIYFSTRINPGIYIANIYVGGKTKEEATRLVANQLKTEDIIKLKAKSQEFELALPDISFSYDLTNTIDKAYNFGKNPNAAAQFASALESLFKKTNMPLVVSFDSKKLEEYLAVVSSQVAQKPIAPTAKITSGRIEIEKGQAGENPDTEAFKDKLIDNLSGNDFSDLELNIITEDESLTDEEAKHLEERAKKLLTKSLSLENEFDLYTAKDVDLVTFLNGQGNYNELSINNYVNKQISPKVKRDPQNAVFRMEGGVVQEFAPAKNGLVVNTDELSLKIKEALSTLENSEEKNVKITVPVATTSPGVTTAEVNNLGIKELIGRGSSRFPGSIPNRIFNVGHAASKFKSVLIPPGEILSFNNILGDVSSLTGYKQAYVIKDGRTVLGDGGGVCQVSTTLFRAALNAGLPIVERRAHAYRVSYYEADSSPGLDATVFYPTTDLKIKNDTPGYILIQSIYSKENLSLVFEIYGTSDGRVATVTKPKITSQTAPPADLYQDDPTLPVGVVKQVDHKAWGAKVSFQYTVTRNGETLIDQTIFSNYRPWQAVFLRGTGPTI